MYNVCLNIADIIDALARDCMTQRPKCEIGIACQEALASIGTFSGEKSEKEWFVLAQISENMRNSTCGVGRRGSV